MGQSDSQTKGVATFLRKIDRNRNSVLKMLSREFVAALPKLDLV